MCGSFISLTPLLVTKEHHDSDTHVLFGTTNCKGKKKRKLRYLTDPKVLFLIVLLVLLELIFKAATNTPNSFCPASSAEITAT